MIKVVTSYHRVIEKTFTAVKIFSTTFFACGHEVLLFSSMFRITSDFLSMLNIADKLRIIVLSQ